jgi:hypothetical protein
VRWLILQVNTNVLAAAVVYWTVGLMFAAVDLLRPAALFKYKIQPSQSVTLQDYIKVSKVVLRNQLFVALPMSAFVSAFFPLRTELPLPGPLTTIGTFFFCLACEEIGFFYVHRYL